jgi:plant G-box-binding factor
MLVTAEMFCSITDHEPSQNGNSAHAPQNGALNTPPTVNQTMSVVPMSVTGPLTTVPGPTTNLNIGMEYWGTPTSSTIPAMHGKVPSTAVAGGMVNAGPRDGVHSQLWLQVNFVYRLCYLVDVLLC